MNTIFDCTLGGTALSSLDSRICILDIQEDAPRMHHALQPLHAGGQRCLASRRESLTVRVKYAIHEEMPVHRRQVQMQINGWARTGGYLTISDRPGQRLHVACQELPAMTAQHWTEELTLVFTSTHTPYWEDADQITVSGTSALSLNVPGTAERAYIEAAIFNTTATTVTSMTIFCGDSHMSFENIRLPSGSNFVLSEDHGNLVATVDGASVLHCRTMDSSDELIAPCGKALSLSVDAAVDLFAFFNVRGRYE